MSKFTSTLISISLILTALLSTIPATAKYLEVGDNCTYQTIQAGINAASAGDTINIRSGIYSIDSSITPKSNIIIAGDSNGQTIIYTNTFSDINSESNPAMIFCNGVSGVTIHDIVFKGPATSLQHQHENGGTSSIGGLRESRNGIKVLNSQSIKIYNCKFTLLLSDGIRITGSSNITIENCIFDCAGHDSISAFRSNKVNINNCLLNQMINTCIRIYNTEGCSVTNSTFKQSIPGTGAGYIELEGTADKVTITKNLFTASSDPVLFIANPAGGSVSITDNALYKVAGLRSSYPPYSVSQQNNQEYSSIPEGYGYKSNTRYISIDKGKETHEEESTILPEETTSAECENCTTTNETDTCEEEIGFITSDFCNSLTANYISFSAEQAETASQLANESSQDLQEAKILLNGTEEQQELGVKYLAVADLKIQYAQELLNLSTQELTNAQNMTNSTGQGEL